jgi:hypothetical protein
MFVNGGKKLFIEKGHSHFESANRIHIGSHYWDAAPFGTTML